MKKNLVSLMVVALLISLAFSNAVIQSAGNTSEEGSVKAVRKAYVLGLGGLVAELENFDFDLKFEVISFDVTATIEGYDYTYRSSSSRFSPEQIKLIKNVRSGTKVFFENIKARGEDGSIRNLKEIVVKVN